MSQRLLNILFWSVISAAFIGPGTITTAAAAGASYGYALIWALIFSTLACFILQEAACRLTAVSGHNLGQALRGYLYDRFWGRVCAWLVLTAILLGCTAYEAGNILGAVAGASLILDVPSYGLVLLTGLCAFLLFAFGSVQLIAKVMGAVVAFMGLCFLTTAFIVRPDVGALLTGALIPALPAGSSMLVLALIGTTVVPYNIFLGSGIATRNQSLYEMRWSLGIAIGLGGLVSIAVVIVGAAIVGEFTFEALARELAASLGAWASTFLGLGLFAAGFSSAVTAPLAAAITARSLLSQNTDDQAWSDAGKYFRSVWIVVLSVGLLFGFTQVEPVPAIILAQALNGLVLPLVAVFLLLMMNNKNLLGRDAMNSHSLNGLMGLVVLATLIIGTTNLLKALSNALPFELVNEAIILSGSIGIGLLVLWPLMRVVGKLRDGAG